MSSNTKDAISLEIEDCLNRLPDDEFSKFVSIHADNIYNHVLRMLQDRQEAEETVQDIFLNVHRGLPEFRGESELRTWLYRITENACITRLRKKPRMTANPDDGEGERGDTWESIAANVKNPEELLIEKDTTSCVLKALEQVSPEDKEILLLFHVDDLKYEEIAATLEIPVGQVGSRLYRARKSVREIMKKEFER